MLKTALNSLGASNKSKMTSPPVVPLTQNFLKMCVIKFDTKSGCIKAKLFFSFRNYIKITEVQIGLSPLPLENSRLSAKPGHGFWSPILRYLCPTKSSSFENFWWLHCMWFLVCSPPIKNPGYAYARGIAFRAVSPQITAWAPKARVNFCCTTTRKLLPKNR